MKNVLFFAVIPLFVISYGCREEQLCPAEYHMGLFELLPSSKETFPYKDSLVNIVFKDSLGNEIEAFARNLAQNQITSIGGLLGNVECKYDSLQEVKVRANTEQLNYFISIPAFDIGFNLSLRASPLIDRYEENLVQDVGLIFFKDSISYSTSGIYPPQLSFLVDIRNSGVIPWNDDAITLLNIGGTDFNNVYINKIKLNIIEFYYNNEIGLIAFQKKSDGTMYVFDRFE